MADLFIPRSRDQKDVANTVGGERPELLLFCGAMGLIGNLAPLVAMICATVLTDHHFLADSVSDLARGPHKWIMDTGFYMHAAALLGLAISAAHVHLGRAGWSIGIFCLAFLALVVVLLGLWDEFGNDPSEMSIHTKLTFLLGPLYLAGPLMMAKGASRVHRRYCWLFVASAILWATFATAFKLAPTAYDGILEKVAVAATMLWTLPLSAMFLARGRYACRLDADTE